MKLPPAIDAAMWELAESNDQAALDAFVARYPEYQAEMAQRLRMVRGLRGLKPTTKARERFVPVAEPLAMPTTNRWMVPVAATLVLGSLVFATVSVTRWIDGQNKAKETTFVDPGTKSNHQPPKPEIREPKPYVDPNKSPGVEQPVVEGPKTPWDKPITLRSERTTLAAALQEIALQAGVTLDFAPNMPDVDIQLDYREQPAKLVMQDMGKNFGFTVLQQTERSALVVPATDPNAHPASVVGKSTVASAVDPETGQGP